MMFLNICIRISCLLIIIVPHRRTHGRLLKGERIHVLAWNKGTGQSRYNPHARKCKGNDGGSEAGDPRTPRASKRLTCANERNESHLPRLCWTAND